MPTNRIRVRRVDLPPLPVCLQHAAELRKGRAARVRAAHAQGAATRLRGVVARACVSESCGSGGWGHRRRSRQAVEEVVRWGAVVAEACCIAGGGGKQVSHQFLPSLFVLQLHVYVAWQSPYAHMPFLPQTMLYGAAC